MRFSRRHRELIEQCLVVAFCAAVGWLFFDMGGAVGAAAGSALTVAARRIWGVA